MEGRFNKGDVVDIVCNGVVIAKGIIGYDSTDLKMIKGKHSDEIEFVLGYKAHDDAVISENIALMVRSDRTKEIVYRSGSAPADVITPIR